MTKELYTKENLYHDLAHDWDGHISGLHGKDLWGTGNEHTRKVRAMVIDECLIVRNKIKKLPLWRRVLNCY